jgi:hypothetical protein
MSDVTSSMVDNIGHLRLTVVTNSIRSIAPATTFVADPAQYLAVEIAAVKPAILYGDAIHLRSYLLDVVTMAAGYRRIRRMPLQRLMVPMQFVMNSTEATLAEYGVDPSLVPRSEFRKFFRRAPKMIENDTYIDEIVALSDKYGDVLARAESALFDAADNFAAALDLANFQKAVDVGILQISGWAEEPPALFESEQDYVNRAGGLICDALLDPSQTLVLDAGAGHMLFKTPVSKGGEVALAGALLKPLPAFSRASIDEIVDIRNELKRPLDRFRARVVKIAQSLPSGEINDVVISEIWRKEIQPALDEIDELTEENSYLRQLGDKVAEAKTMLPATATFALGVAGLSGIAQVAAAAAGVAAVPLEALRVKRKQAADLRRKEFYFLWNMRNRGKQ